MTISLHNFFEVLSMLAHMVCYVDMSLYDFNANNKVYVVIVHGELLIYICDTNQDK